jgi:hypothetical protein
VQLLGLEDHAVAVEEHCALALCHRWGRGGACSRNIAGGLDRGCAPREQYWDKKCRYHRGGVDERQLCATSDVKDEAE